MGFRFADCELWPAQRLLLCRGRALAIGGRAFDLLHALVENSHRLMEKNELLERVWPGLAVEPNNLQVQVWTLRRLLGHGAIATVARRGFRFMLPVLPAIPGAPGLQRVPAPSLAPAGQDGDVVR
jgi:DNA-binding winged helix-turn-helix (wHTH) protein